MDFNERFFEDLLASEQVEELVVGRANAVLAAAKSTAPVKTGAYQAGLEVQVKRQARVVAMVVGTDPKTLLVEAKKGTLQRALRSVK